MITAHRLSESGFVDLAAGGGDPAMIRQLREAEQSKHVMVLWAIAEAAGGDAPGANAFHAAYVLLTRVQVEAPEAHAWTLSLPHLGAWGHDSLVHLDQGTPVDFAYFACLAAAAAVRAGISFTLEVPVRDGHVPLPGLGAIRVTGELAESSWTWLRGDADCVIVDECFALARHRLCPNDGTVEGLPEWSGTPLIRAETDGLTWEVLLETADPYLDRYPLPMSAELTPDEVDRWCRRVRSAWEVLVRHHRWVAESLAEGISVIVPMTPRAATDSVSATAPAAFGAVATSWPADVVTLAETLVHEFQHLKLCGLIDLVALVEPGGEKIYAPWRQDPRPVGGLLQGVYAHLGVGRFWNVQQRVETTPDGVLHAQVSFARWRSTIDPTVRSLLRTGCLTEDGVRFVRVVQEQGRLLDAEHLPGEPRQIAGEIDLDHRLTWQLRHVIQDADEVEACADAYRQGEPFREHSHRKPGVEEWCRQVDSELRTRLLSLRYLEPARYRRLRAEGPSALSEVDALLLDGGTSTAVEAYRELIAGSPVPRPDAWVGLALALHRLPASPMRAAFTVRLPLMFEVHTHLGGQIDPLELAGWFA